MESTNPQAKIEENNQIEDDADFYDIVQAKYAGMPPRSQKEVDEDINYFVNHPLNAKKLTPEMMELPEYQAL